MSGRTKPIHDHGSKAQLIVIKAIRPASPIAMQPKKAFDDVYWLGTESTSAWLLTSDDGYILYDTAYVYDAEDVLIGWAIGLGDRAGRGAGRDQVRRGN